ncbi:hypothetical protein BDY24DRAFT_341601 [Mrakia frigida]|uniref:heat shock factor family protein n=1 Tax=Mrakia frigida TaxID=29902 RepID=UPI003FCC0EB1
MSPRRKAVEGQSSRVDKVGLAGVGVKVPAFISKLYSMVDDSSTNNLIYWSERGDSFLIPRQELIGKELLPRFFKHSNFSSFIRQLNMYGFRKVPHLESAVLEPNSSSNLWEFKHVDFLRHRPDLLPLVQRRKSQTTTTGPTLDSSFINGEPTSFSLATSQQSSISQELKALRTNNAELWTEILASRERHERQQETTNRILSFLAGIFGDGITGSVNGKGMIAEALGVGEKEERKGKEAGGWERTRREGGQQERIGLVERSEEITAELNGFGLPLVDWGNEEMEEVSSSESL